MTLFKKPQFDYVLAIFTATIDFKKRPQPWRLFFGAKTGKKSASHAHSISKVATLLENKLYSGLKSTGQKFFDDK